MTTETLDGILILAGTVATALFGFLGIIATAVFKSKTDAREARNENDRQLTTVIDTTTRTETRMSALEIAVSRHLQWHIEKGTSWHPPVPPTRRQRRRK